MSEYVSEDELTILGRRCQTEADLRQVAASFASWQRGCARFGSAIAGAAWMTNDNDPEEHSFSTPGVTACVRAGGAELCTLRDSVGTEYLWSAAPIWPRHAPVLFPIVGRLRNDTLVHEGRSYHLTQHGFARDRRFSWVRRFPTGCVLALRDDAQTRTMYPFPFRFEIHYSIEDLTLAVTFRVTNSGDTVLPASMGAHPAFRWPLVSGLAKEAYLLTFDADETAPIRGVADGLLTDAVRPSPINGRHLPLEEQLFSDDALILPHPASRSVRFAAAQGPAVTVAWAGFTQLGLWSRTGGDFLCIEPWSGMASPSDFTGEFMHKPWLMLIPPGESRSAAYRITVEP
jgi:galactose mutarotase-like enzyme